MRTGRGRGEGEERGEESRTAIPGRLVEIARSDPFEAESLLSFASERVLCGRVCQQRPLRLGEPTHERTEVKRETGREGRC
jgi:hypothetical protein